MNAVTDTSLEMKHLLGGPEAQDETLELVRYWRAISRSKWLILGLAVAIGVLATMVANSLRPTYRATSTILIESSKPKLV
jgi:uncharacterized protein involved in exopolysaccharide biosynthesis